MILYQMPISHYCGKVRIVLIEKGIDFDMPHLPGDSAGSPDFLKISPLGKVPVLDDDGLVIGESEAICEYLEEKQPAPPMLPDGIVERARSRWLSRIHDLYLGPQLSPLFHGVLNEQTETPEMQDTLKVLFDQLTIVENAISPDPYFFGERFCISDAAYCLSIWYALSLADQYGFPITSKQYPRLSKWFAEASERTSAVRVIEDAKQVLG